MNGQDIANWRILAERGDEWAMDKLLSRPIPSGDLAPYWNAFAYLGRDRPRENISLGLGGSISFNRPIPVERIRSEGVRLGYSGEALEDFEAIVVAIDDRFVEITVKQEAANAKAAAQRTRQKQQR